MAKGFKAKNIIDRIGEKSGRLTVISRGPNKADGSAQWYCQCDCGNEKIVLLPGNSIKNQRTKSCGCLAEEHRQWIIENQANLLAEYRNRPTPMSTCHPDRLHAARGLCDECYNKLKQTFHPEQDKANGKARREREGKSTVPGSAVRRRQLKYLYNITPKDYDQMLAEQGNVCACCGLPETRKYKNTDIVLRLQVDHNHKCCPGKRSCGKCIRGLTCFACGVLLGRAKDDIPLFSTFIEYLSAGSFKNMKALEQEVERCIGGC